MLQFILAAACLLIISQVAIADDISGQIKIAARSVEKSLNSPPKQTQARGDASASSVKSYALDPSPTTPTVVLSDAHRKLCLKTVGDSVGTSKVTDINGKTYELRQLLSDRLTVLVFWDAKSALAAEQFRRLPVDVLAKFATHRVRVIAVNVGGSLEATKTLTGDAADKIVSLVDEQKSLFHEFAKQGVPRTYLLDNQGEIVWFDMEYSLGMQRSLDNAVTYFLKKK